MSSYAADTTVPVETSLTDIQRTLTRYGAKKFGLLREEDGVVIMFTNAGDTRRVRITMRLPDIKEYSKTETGRARKGNAQQLAWEQAVRSRYRALGLVIKAKLEAVVSGIETFDQAFFPYILLPNGATVEEEVGVQVAHAYESGQMGRFMLTSGGA